MDIMKKALVIGGGGFIGHNLVKRLKKEGWWVKGFDLKYPVYEKTSADEFRIGDASKEVNVIDQSYDRIYQLAADMGGAGFIFTGENDADILNTSASINLNVLRQMREVKDIGIGKIFYSSSVCCYPDGVRGVESDAYPANPPSDYGFEKLFSERAYLAYHRNYGIDVRIARFHNCFGPYGTYEGGREKAPAAICRKVLKSDGEVEVWGDGTQLRPFIYIEDLLDGIEALMESNFTGPVNLGPSEGITIDQLVYAVADIAGKDITIRHVKGPTGGYVRNANNDLAQMKLKWKPKWPLTDALKETYNWIKQQYA